MKLTWLGTAGFQVDTGAGIFLIDPYLSRNPKARPVQPLTPRDVAGAREVFITHGHFDHLYDVPAIVDAGNAVVYCSEIAAGTLERKGVDRGRLHSVAEDGYKVDLGAYTARAFFSQHVKFDAALVARTLARIGPKGLAELSSLSKDYPEGQVLSWLFTVNGLTMHHFGSGGSTSDELQRLAHSPLDLLLIPLQGHSHICDIAFQYVRILKPRMVIAHHQDDFYPPISSYVDIGPFVKMVRESCPGTELRQIDFNETIIL